MDVRSRGTLLTSAGLLFASIGFTLSVLSTLLRLLLPFYPTRGADAASTIRRRHDTIRRASQSKHSRRKSVAPSTRTHLTTSSYSSASSSEEESCSTTPPSSSRRHPHHSNNNTSQVRQRPRSVERRRSTIEERPDFRGRDRHSAADPHHRRRSESTPPSPSPWATFSDTTGADAPSASNTHLARRPSMDEHLTKHAGVHVSFLHLNKVHRTPSVPTGLSTSPKKSSPLAPAHAPSHSREIHRNTSQIFADFLHHKRRSIHESDKTSHRWSMASSTADHDEDSGSSPEAHRPSHEASSRSSHDYLPVPKRSQTMRTRPYEAPYFFPAPGSVQADEYVAVARPRPVRSGTLPVSRPESGSF